MKNARQESKKSRETHQAFTSCINLLRGQWRVADEWADDISILTARVEQCSAELAELANLRQENAQMKDLGSRMQAKLAENNLALDA